MAGTTEGNPSFGIRPLDVDDGARFVQLVTELSDESHRFLKEHLDPSEEAFERILRAPSRRLVAVRPDGAIVGLAGAFPGTGWSAHVAELRIVVANAWRGKGVGRALARAALLEAWEMGCSHSFVEVVAEQEALVDMFQDMGFEPEALLVDFVRDEAGQCHDLMLLTHRTDHVPEPVEVLDLEVALP